MYPKKKKERKFEIKTHWHLNHLIYKDRRKYKQNKNHCHKQRRVKKVRLFKEKILLIHSKVLLLWRQRLLMIILVAPMCLDGSISTPHLSFYRLFLFIFFCNIPDNGSLSMCQVLSSSRALTNLSPNWTLKNANFRWIFLTSISHGWIGLRRGTLNPICLGTLFKKQHLNIYFK